MSLVRLAGVAAALSVALPLAGTATSPVLAAPAAPATSYAAAPAQQVRVVTANVDFGLSARKVRKDLARIRPQADVILVQEARDVRLRKLVPRKGWAVKQRTSSPARRGSAVLVRRSIATSIGGLSLVRGVGASPCDDIDNDGKPDGINTRYIARVDIGLVNGTTLKVASLHMPPPRCWGSVYNRMADSVVRMTRNTRGRLVLGADWNKIVRNDPNDINGRTGLKIRAPRGFDGFYVRSSIPTTRAKALFDTRSDHDPVRMTITLGG